MLYIFLAGGFIALAYYMRSTFMQIMSGLLAIGAGIAYIGLDPTTWTYIMVGVVIIGIGLYQLIIAGVDLFKGG